MRQAQLIQRIIGLRVTGGTGLIVHPHHSRICSTVLRHHSQLFCPAEKQEQNTKVSSLVNETGHHNLSPSLFPSSSFDGQQSRQLAKDDHLLSVHAQENEFELLSSPSSFHHQQPPADKTKNEMTKKPASDHVSPKMEHFLDEKISSFSTELIQMAEQITTDSTMIVGKTMHTTKKRNIDKMYMSLQFQQIILPYLHACVNSSLTDRAFTTINWYNFKNKMFDNCDPQLILNISNILLKGYAIQNRLSGTNQVLKLLRHFDIQPDLQSYAWYLYILAKNDRTHLAARILTEMRDKHLQVDKLFQKSSLNNDQRFVIRQFIKKVDPTIEFCPPLIPDELAGDIVRSLNEQPRVEYLPLDHQNWNEWNADQAFAEQIRMEREGRIKIRSVYCTQPTRQMQFCRHEIQKLEKEWRSVILTALESNLDMLKSKYSEFNGMNLYPYLCTLDLNAVANLMVDEAMSLGRMHGTYSPPSYLNYLNLGKKIQNHYITQVTLKTFPELIELYEDYLNTYYRSEMQMGQRNSRQFWQYIAHQKRYYMNCDIDQMMWPYSVLVSVGKLMYEILIKELKINANLFRSDPSKSVGQQKKRLVPAFISIYTRNKLKLQEEIRSNLAFSRLFTEAQMDDIHFEPSMLPMVVPPVPWTSPKRGGFLFTSVEIIRENLNEVSICRSKLKNQNLNGVYDALNAVSLCPWKINKPILDVMIKIFNENGNIDLDIPLHQVAMPILPKVKDSENKDERIVMIRKRFKQKKENSEMYSQWCDCLYKLSIANHYRDKIFWFPHNLDFRGRVYPFPPHFNHLGNDVSRGMLMFAKGKPLGEDGFKWLKIHLINLTGLMKRKSLDERAQYADQIMDDIIDSAENPLNGKGWWMQSDEPWQTLACCSEIRNVHKSGVNPADYVSSFPVHQDGSCNGLQHYAALGRDLEGARSVNLEPNPVPSDVYSDVAALVELDRSEDAANGVEIAKLLDGRVGRKVVKTTVMTYVYGVTVYGAKLQIFKNIKDLKDFPEEHRWKASLYLTEKVFTSILKMFKSTKAIQDWLTQISIGVSKNLNLPVEWITPLGFPVIQPYLSKDMQTELDNSTSRTKVKVNSLKQKNGFPPNYIHSLDSSHMMLTALMCERKGITFVSVHDSFWTHPCDINAMNVICRQQFVNLHSQNLLQDLSDFFVQNYSIQNSDRQRSKERTAELIQLFKRVPTKGSFQLENVLQSTYFFS